MKRIATLLVLVALALVGTNARADRPVFVFEAKAGYTIIGSKNPTQGFFPQASAAMLFTPGEGVRLGVGLDAGVLFAGSARHIGFVGGPLGRLELNPWSEPIAVRLTVASGLGRLTRCTVWPVNPICARFWGSFPEASIGVVYLGKGGLLVGGEYGVRIVDTWVDTALGHRFVATIGGAFGLKQ